MALDIGHSSGEMRGDINVTPLIDVLLVLLIIFMVIVQVIQINGAGSGPVSYKINQEDVSISELGSRLSSILSVRADKVIFVRGDDHLEFSTIAAVMNIVRTAGADHIGLLTSKDKV